MARTLLQGVNEVLKRANIITSGSELTSLTDASRQTFIDVAVQIWNEAVEELYSSIEEPLPVELAESTITLVQGQRTYTLATDMVEFYFPLLDETNHHYIFEFSGGYRHLVNVQSNPADFIGLPSFGVIDPRTANTLFLEYAPDAASAGRIYKYRYDKELSLALAADEFPFNDTVFRAMVPAVAQLWERDQRRDFDPDIFAASLGRAARLVNPLPSQDNWHNRQHFSD